MKSRLLALALLLAATSSTTAFAMGKGTSMLAIELTNGTADLAAPGFGPTGYISAFSTPEIGIQAQCWKMMADDYAFTVSVGLGFSNEKDEPGAGAPANATDITFKTSSFNVRVGGDRVVKVGERALMFGGPGIEIWSGKAKSEQGGAPPAESENTTRIGLSTRIGATIMLDKTCGLSTHVGHQLGRASSEDSGAKATWWASGFEGAMGFMYFFGGK